MRQTEIVEIELDDGVIRVEALVSAAGDVGGWSFRRFSGSELGNDVRRISRWLVAQLRDATPDPPDRIGIEFGVTIAAESGRVFGVLGKMGAETALVVKLEWTKPGAGEVTS